MKRSARSTSLAGWLLIAPALLAPCAARAGTAPQPLPTPFPETRYQQMTTRSPFAIATAAAAPAATPGFASQLYIDGVAHIGQTDYVAIKSRDPDKPTTMFLEVGGTSQDGMKIESVQWSPEMGRSTVDVVKSGERATLGFDEQTIKTPAGAAPVPAGMAARGLTPFGQQGARPDPNAPLTELIRPPSGPFAHPAIRRPRVSQ
jgi:hypothetical protein